MKNRLTMTMVDKILFASGSADISREGKKVLDKVITILKDIKDKRIQVEATRTTCGSTAPSRPSIHELELSAGAPRRSCGISRKRAGWTPSCSRQRATRNTSLLPRTIRMKARQRTQDRDRAAAVA